MDLFIYQNVQLFLIPSFWSKMTCFFCRVRGVAAFAQHGVSLCQLPGRSQQTLTGGLRDFTSVVVIFSSVQWAAQLPGFSQGKKAVVHGMPRSAQSSMQIRKIKVSHLF